MSTTQSEIQDSIHQLLRQSAQRYGDAVTQYGAAFIAYGNGDIDATRVAESTLKLVISEARNALETGVSLGAAYAKWTASMVGIRDLRADVKTAESTAPKKSKL